LLRGCPCPSNPQIPAAATITGAAGGGESASEIRCTCEQRVQGGLGPTPPASTSGTDSGASKVRPPSNDNDSGGSNSGGGGSGGGGGGGGEDNNPTPVGPNDDLGSTAGGLLEDVVKDLPVPTPTPAPPVPTSASTPAL
jgi:hypothetical protein